MKQDRWKQRLWIIDGHNVIYGLPKTSQLQRQGDLAGARCQLERLLAPFASGLSRNLIIVYDGNEMITNPEGGTRAGFQILFSQPPEEEADDRIIFLAKQATDRHEAVSIVTDDRRTLSPRLPMEVSVVGVIEFRDKYLTDPDRKPAEEKSVSVETEQELAEMFLKRAPEIMSSARQGARHRARDGLKRWQAIHGGAKGETGGAPDADIDGDGEEVDYYEPTRRFPVSPQRDHRQEQKSAPVSPSPLPSPDKKGLEVKRLQREREIQQEKKKKKGERKQQRRLAQQKKRKGKK